MKPQITKTQIKTITIANKYSYRVLLVEADNNHWLEAQPIAKGIQRTAEDERILRIILENDAINMERQQQKVR